jgi:erythromycin esterase-like protein
MRIFNEAFDAGLKAAKVNHQDSIINEIVELYKELDTENKDRVRLMLEEVCSNCNDLGYHYTIGECAAPVSQTAAEVVKPVNTRAKNVSS